MLEIKNTTTEIRNAFNEFSRLGTTEKRISELEDFSIGFCQTEKQTEKIVKKKKKGTEYPRIVVQLPKVQSGYNGKIRGEKRREQKEYLK